METLFYTYLANYVKIIKSGISKHPACVLLTRPALAILLFDEVVDFIALKSLLGSSRIF